MHVVGAVAVSNPHCRKEWWIFRCPWVRRKPAPVLWSSEQLQAIIRKSPKSPGGQRSCWGSRERREPIPLRSRKNVAAEARSACQARRRSLCRAAHKLLAFLSGMAGKRMRSCLGPTGASKPGRASSRILRIMAGTSGERCMSDASLSSWCAKNFDPERLELARRRRRGGAPWAILVELGLMHAASRTILCSKFCQATTVAMQPPRSKWDFLFRESTRPEDAFT